MFVYTLSDIIGLGILIIILVGFGCIQFASYVQQRLCKHDGGVNETMACQAICRKCGKDLGFIGTWRESQLKK